jgi:ComF family protein
MSSGNYFAQRMSASLVHAFDIKDIDFITCVPMHILKKLNRGYNQSEYLARIIAKNVGLPFKNVLYEQKNNKTQHKQTGRNDRFLNVKNRYKVRTRTSFKGKTILIVDDIITTGATLSECARLLKLKGAEKVFCVTALKTLYKENNTKSDQTIEKPQTIL